MSGGSHRLGTQGREHRGGLQGEGKKWKQAPLSPRPDPSVRVHSRGEDERFAVSAETQEALGRSQVFKGTRGKKSGFSTLTPG